MSDPAVASALCVVGAFFSRSPPGTSHYPSVSAGSIVTLPCNTGECLAMFYFSSSRLLSFRPVGFFFFSSRIHSLYPPLPPASEGAGSEARLPRKSQAAWACLVSAPRVASLAHSPVSPPVHRIPLLNSYGGVIAGPLSQYAPCFSKHCR